MTCFDDRVLYARGHLWLVLGLTPAVACGAKVVFVEDGGGGAGGAPTTSEPWCGDPTGLQYVCFQTFEACPELGSDELFGLLQSKLSEDQSCTAEPQFCWCEWTVEEVPCGPDPSALECCYFVAASVSELCEGRPFIIDGAPSLAPIVQRADWLGGGIAEQGRRAAPRDQDRELLAAAWAESARCEHASIASFARFTLELLALGAPLELVRDAEQAMADEIAHAAACFGITSELVGGSDLGPGPLAIEGALAGRVDAATIVAATVREGCIGETLSALGAALARDQATDPHVRGVLARVADDELRHAALAWRFVGWALRQNLPGAREAALRAFSIPCGLTGGVADTLPAETARAFGVLPADDRARLHREAWRSLIEPTARALLAEDRPLLTAMSA